MSERERRERAGHLEDLRAAVRRYTAAYGGERQWSRLFAPAKQPQIDWPAMRLWVAALAARLERLLAEDDCWVDGRNWAPEVREGLAHARGLLAGMERMIALEFEQARSDG
jgi:hypothetical protein